MSSIVAGTYALAVEYHIFICMQCPLAAVCHNLSTPTVCVRCGVRHWPRRLGEEVASGRRGVVRRAGRAAARAQAAAGAVQVGVWVRVHPDAVCVCVASFAEHSSALLRCVSC